jgi:sugar lactone lactonase YvrE
MLELQTVSTIRAQLGEGPLWHKGAIYWVDILGKKIYRYFPAENWLAERQLDQYVGALVPRKKRGFIVAMQHGLYSLNGLNGRLKPLVAPEANKTQNRFNDGKCDSLGRFWAGTMAQDASPGQGALYLLNEQRKVQKKYSPVTISNGLCWSLDNRYMYYIDTRTNQITVFDFNLATGEITHPQPLITIEEELGSPDGMTIDAEGDLWVALYHGGAVVCYDPRTAKLLYKIKLPVSQVSSCTFGGLDLDELYITTASTDVSLQKEPLAGRLFKIKLGVRGLPANSFAG